MVVVDTTVWIDLTTDKIISFARGAACGLAKRLLEFPPEEI